MKTKTTNADYERVVRVVTETLEAGTPGLTPGVEFDPGAAHCDETNSFRRSYTYIATTAQVGRPLDAQAVVERIRSHWRSKGYTWRETADPGTADGTPTLGMTVDGFRFEASVPDGGHVLSVVGQSPCK